MLLCCLADDSINALIARNCSDMAGFIPSLTWHFSNFHWGLQVCSWKQGATGGHKLSCHENSPWCVSVRNGSQSNVWEKALPWRLQRNWKKQHKLYWKAAYRFSAMGGNSFLNWSPFVRLGLEIFVLVVHDTLESNFLFEDGYAYFMESWNKSFFQHL